MRTSEKEHNQSINYNDARIERENKRICIVACIILACGSLLMYKNSSSMVWGLILLVSVFIGLYLLSKLAELDDILSDYDNASISVETKVNESIEEENIYEEVLDTEETRRKFMINMPLFKDEAYAKYMSLINELGMTDKCIGDGVMDVWATIDGIFGINKWEFFDQEISKFGGRYTNAIIRGEGGRCVDFCELRIPFTELDRLGMNPSMISEMVEYNNELKQKKMEEKTKEPKKRTRRKKEPAKPTLEDENMQFIIDVLQGSTGAKNSTSKNNTSKKRSSSTKTKKEQAPRKEPNFESYIDFIKMYNDVVEKKNN